MVSRYDKLQFVAAILENIFLQNLQMFQITTR